MALTPDDIKNKQFTTTRGFGEGYVETEVDDFLDEVYEEFTRLLTGQGNGHAPGTASEVTSADVTSSGGTAPVSAGPAAIAPPARPVVTPAADDQGDQGDRDGRNGRDTPVGATPAGAGTVSQTPIEAATGILALAQRTAEEHVSSAREEADQLLSDARREAEELRREAEQARRNELGALQSEHTQLERTIESLRTFEREYRSRLRAYLDAQLHELDAAVLPEPDGARRFLLDEGRNA